MRRAGAARREVLADPKYGSRLVAKFVNIMMIRGKKSTAERIMYDALASIEDRAKQDPRVGKVTHPAAAPDNHVLTVWSPGSVNSHTRYTPAFDSGIYLIKSGKAVDEPGQMLGHRLFATTDAVAGDRS